MTTAHLRLRPTWRRHCWTRWRSNGLPWWGSRPAGTPPSSSQRVTRSARGRSSCCPRSPAERPCRTPQLNNALGRLMMTRRFQNPAYFLIHGAPHAPNLAATHWVPASCHRRDLHAGLRAEISPYRRRSSVSLLRAASDPIVQEMPEGRAGRGRLAARLSQGKPPKTGSFRPPVTSILTRFRWPRSSTRLPAVLMRAGAGRCRVEVEAVHADDDGRCRRIAGQRQRRQRRQRRHTAAGRGRR